MFGFIGKKIKKSDKPRVMVFANQKGGVGKTTTAINLGCAVAEKGYKVLIIDLDPQGNASTGLGIYKEFREFSSYDVLVDGMSVNKATVETGVKNLYLVPSTLDLLGIEATLANDENRSFKLKEAIQNMLLETVKIEDNYHYIFIDCPPSLNLLTINALAASDAVMVPLQCEFYALEGLGQLLETVDHVRKTLNDTLIIHGIVLTMVDDRNNLSGQVEKDVREYMKNKVYQTVIPRNVRVSEAPSYGKPVLIYDHKCSGSKAYIKLASEMLNRDKDMKYSN
jgi:chromosome partitioning protein|tara:strand:- start:3454 stop:4296 length:843 start_codon:yes stop_codon:yes gene_type:complete